MKNKLIVKVKFNSEEVYGFVRFKDYKKAIKSMEHKDHWEWLYVPVLSPTFSQVYKYRDGICNFCVSDIKIIGTTEDAKEMF